MFQSSPGRRTGCNFGRLTRVTADRYWLFQSSPGRRTGCNRRRQSSVGNAPFQSSPGRRTGCNVQISPTGTGPMQTVSILTRSSDRMQPRPSRRWQAFQSSPGRRCWQDVSARYQCFNPHPVVGPDATAGPLLFQSSPGRRTGCNWSTFIGVSILTRSSDRMQQGGQRTHERFNPHPVVGPDATLAAWSRSNGVSILTRSSDRMQPRGCS